MRKRWLILVAVLVAGFLGWSGQRVWAAETCEPGDLPYCDGNKRCVCNGEQYVCTNCTHGCLSGNCRICTEGSFRCRGNLLQKCVRNAWDDLSFCPYGCDATTGSCFDCTGTEELCRDGSFYVCTDGRWVYSYDCGGLGCEDSSKCNYVMCGPFGEGDPYDFSEVTFDSNCKPVANYCQPGSVLYKPELEYLDEGFEYASWNWVWSCTDKYGECNSGAITYRNPYCGSVSCDMMWSKSQCVTAAYCGTPLGNVSGCPAESGQTCCNDPFRDDCESDQQCILLYGDCYKCGTSIPRKCYRSVITGGSGRCANLGSVCNLPAASELCDSNYGSTVTDGSGGDGDFNWTCLGQGAGTCRTAGSSASCSAGKLSLVNGVCGVDDGTCSAGSVYDVGTTAVRSDGIYSLWSCNGICSGSSANCEHKLCSRVNGLCGSANGGNFATAPTTGLCSSGTASPVIINPTTFVWSCNGSCGGTSESCLATYDTAPSLESTVLETTGGRVIDVEVGGRNHSCDSAFAGSKTSVWTITARDEQGLADIGLVTLRFRGPTTINMPPVATVNGVARVSVDMTTLTPGTYNVEVLIDDIHNPPGNRGWIDTGRDFKVWDCLVNISGTFYDGSEVPISCSANSGYTDLIPSGINFDLRYQIGTSAPRIMTVNSPNFSADNNNRLYWNSPVDYQPQLAYFPGTDPTQARINGNCYNTSALDPKIADPYLTNPSLTIEYSTVLDQSAWYRASGGAIITKGTLTNYVPGTCTAANCMTVAGNIILSDGKASLSPYDKINSNIVYDNQTVDFKLYSYDTLKRKYFFTKGYGTTVPASITNWTDVETKSGVIFVEGDLTIDTNIATTDLVMIVAKGDITINPNVTRVDGILFGKSITASGESASQLVINGSIYGLNSVVLNRSFNPKKSNNTTPAVEVRYNPSLIFKLPAKMIQNITRWRLLQ